MRVFGLVGYPLGHSFSKKYFDNKFADEGIDNSRFELFPIESIEAFPGLIRSQPDLCGLAVTIPHKQAVMQYLDALHDTAEKVGAVNCIRVQKGKLTGYNTDALGFEKSLSHFVPNEFTSNVLILGTGGAAKAVEYVLRKKQIAYRCVSRRAGLSCFDYASLDKNIIDQHKLIINCSPAGMTPNDETAPEIPYQFLTNEHFLHDLVYKPEETLFMKKGKERGAKVKNGMEMLLAQAEENWKIWDGR